MDARFPLPASPRSKVSAFRTDRVKAAVSSHSLLNINHKIVCFSAAASSSLNISRRGSFLNKLPYLCRTFDLTVKILSTCRSAMCVNGAYPCAPCRLSSDGPLGENFPSNGHAQSKGYVSNHTYLSPHCVISVPMATASRLPDDEAKAFEGTLHPDYVQQPPDWIIDYWFGYLGLSLDTTPPETPSNLPTLPSSFPVRNDIGSDVSQSRFSHNTQNLNFGACAFLGGGLLIGFHRPLSTPRIPGLLL